MIFTNQKERTRFLKFAFVGIVGAVVDFGIFNILISLGNMAAVVASIISFISAVVSNFIWNRYWTYPDSRSKPLGRQVFQFVIVSLIGLLIRTPLFAWLEPIMIQFFSGWGISLPFTTVFLGHNISLAIAILVVMLWNFIANRYWTYNDVE